MALQVNSIRSRVFISALLLLLLACFSYIAMIRHFRRPSEYRFSFPANKKIEEIDAIEFSKRALIRLGKHSASMRPVPSGHVNPDGSDIFFCRTKGDQDEGWVLWWLGSNRHKWEYKVDITRVNGDIMCRISKPL